MTYGPVQIGPLTIESPVIVAPLAGISVHPFRLLARRHGAAMVCTEMIKARPLYERHKNLRKLLLFSEEERPVGIQIAAATPEEGQRAAALIAEGGPNGEYTYDFVDLNLGCPVRKVLRSKCGSYFTDRPQESAAIVAALRRELDQSSRPIALTAKIRAGVSADQLTAVEQVKALTDAGAQAITMHMRVRHDGHWGPCHEDLMAEAVKATHVPMFANGSVDSPQRAKQLMDETGCAGVMIARACFGNPWLFGRIAEYLTTGVLNAMAPTVREVRETMEWHFHEALKLFGEYIGCRVNRRYVTWYSKGLQGGAEFRNRAVEITSAAAFEALVEEFFSQYDPESRVPLADFYEAPRSVMKLRSAEIATSGRV